MAHKGEGIIPTSKDKQLARKSSKELANLVAREKRALDQLEFYVRVEKEQIPLQLPSIALRLLKVILDEMAVGNAVTLMPIHAELTSQEAADLLNVSRPFLIKLLEEKSIPYHKVGRNRRIKLRDLLKFKESFEKSSDAALDELLAQAQDLDMGY